MKNTCKTHLWFSVCHYASLQPQCFNFSLFFHPPTIYSAPSKPLVFVCFHIDSILQSTVILIFSSPGLLGSSASCTAPSHQMLCLLCLFAVIRLCPCQNSYFLTHPGQHFPPNSCCLQGSMGVHYCTKHPLPDRSLIYCPYCPWYPSPAKELQRDPPTIIMITTPETTNTLFLLHISLRQHPNYQLVISES